MSERPQPGADSQHRFVADHYGPRADAYVASAVHASGADLDQIEEAVRDRGFTRALDLGCGGGHVSYRVAPHVGTVTAVDLTAEMLDSVRRTATERGLTNIDVTRSPAERLPFEDGWFDLVLCRFTVHHWRDAEAGIREARRVLAPGGKAILIDVVAPAHPLLDTHLQAVEILRDVSHVRNYSVSEWAGILARAGFAVTGLTNRRLRMDFPVWIARTGASDLHARAIRSLQENAAPEVRRHFAIEADGSFLLDSVTFTLDPA